MQGALKLCTKYRLNVKFLYYRHNNFMKCKKLSRDTKMRLYITIIRSVVVHSVEMKFINRVDKKKMRIYEGGRGRGVKDRGRNVQWVHKSGV